MWYDRVVGGKTGVFFFLEKTIANLVGVSVVELVLRQHKLGTDHDCTATGQIF